MKNGFLYIITAILALLLFLATCKTGCNKSMVITKSDTIRITDTSYLAGDTVIITKYKPIKGKIVKADSIPVANTDVDTLTKQYTELAKKHYSEITYNDSVKLQDDRYKGKDLGTVYIKDVVSQNELRSRDIKYSLKFPVINNTTTITNTVEAKKKIQLYGGVGLTGNGNEVINGINGMVSLKTRRDVLYGVTAGYQQSFGKVYPQFGASIQFKIGKKK